MQAALWEPTYTIVHNMLHRCTQRQAPGRAHRGGGHHPCRDALHCAQALNLAGKLGLFTTLCEQGQWPWLMEMVAVRQAGL